MDETDYVQVADSAMVAGYGSAVSNSNKSR